MFQNFEIKARYDKLDFAEKQAVSIGADLLGIDHQTDTYFTTRMGRFKLRNTTLSQPYLIPYLRSSEKDIKLSRYEKIPVENPESVKYLFTQLLGRELEIRKKRKIYIFENVRIHLDEVEELGTFIELESVFDPDKSDERLEKKKINRLMELFEINNDSLLSLSYYELIREYREKS